MTGGQPSRGRRAALILGPIAVLAYLVAMGICTAIGRPLPAAILLIALLVAAIVRALAAGQRAGAALEALTLALALAVLWFAGPMKVLELTLVIVQATVSALFLRSLLGGRTDIVTQIACEIHPGHSPRQLAYTRAVSWSWVWFMAALAATSLAFAFAAPPRWWWWWKLVAGIPLPVAFFLAEWSLRQWILRGEEKAGFRRTLRALPRIDYPRLFQI